MNRYLLSLACCFFASVAIAAPPDLQGKSLAATFAEMLPGISKGDSGEQQRWQDLCFALGAPGNEKLRVEACKLMIAKLDAKTPKPGRTWLLKQLERIGGEESVEALGNVLNDPDDEVRDDAARALANNSSKKATTELVRALGTAEGKAKIGILNGLGHRGDAAAIDAVAKELRSKDEKVAVAAARSLGRIPGAVIALFDSGGGAKGAVEEAINDAMLVQLDRLPRGGMADDIKTMYSVIFLTGKTKAIRLAALRGIIQTSGDKAGDFILGILNEDNAGEKAIAIGQIENLSAAALKPLAASLDKLPVPTRVLVITAIAARGDKSQLPVALAAAKNANAEVKRAGLHSLGRLGDATVVEFLLDAMSGKDATAGIAAESLAALPAEGVNEKLIAVLEAEKTPARAAALITVLEQRKAVAGVPSLLKAAAGNDATVRTAAFNALKTLASPNDIPGMIAALLKTAKGGEREQAEQAIATVAAQVAPAKRAEPVLAAIKADTNRTTDLLPLLGLLGGADAIKVVREAAAGTNSDLRDAAIVALCNWPDTAANDDLLALAEKGKDAEKLRALQALIRINTGTEWIGRTPDERLAALNVMKKAMPLTTRDNEKRAILDGIGFVRHIETLRFVLPYLDQPALAQSACRGVVELAHSKMLREPNKAEFAKPLDRVIAMCKDKALVDRAKQYKEGR